MIKRNIAANFVGRAAGVLTAYIFIPVYIKYLGMDAYGLVGFYSTLMGVLVFADMGFTATLNREMARLSVRETSTGEMRQLLRTYETAYTLGVLTLALGIFLLAPLIAAHWLRSHILTRGEIVVAIRLMGWAAVLQLPAGLYLGGLNGLQKQVTANTLQVSWSLVRGLGAIAVLSMSPTIGAFAWWQLISTALYCGTSRWTLWHVLSHFAVRPVFSLRVLLDTWRYAAGMTGMAAISTILTQTDKVVVSKLMSLDAFGYYTLASMLAAAPTILAGPIATAIFPRLTALVAAGDQRALSALYHRSCELVALAVVPAALTLAFFSGEFLSAWTGSTAAAQRVAAAGSLLIGGQLLQALTIVPYYLVLANGDVQLNLRMGLVSVAFVTPLLVFLTLRFGLTGAGLSWFLMNLCTLPLFMYFMHRRFLKDEFRRWFTRGIALPLVFAIPSVGVIRAVYHPVPSRILTLLMLGGIWALSTVCVIFGARSFANP